jgi:hypothetical protein
MKTKQFVLFTYHLWGNSVHEKYLTSSQCTQLKARSGMKILKNENVIMLFLRRAMAYLEGWKVSVEFTDVKTKDMVLCSLIWPVAHRVGANARTWSCTWMMSSSGKQNISLQCYVTHHESCVKSPRSEIKAPWWVAIIILLSDGTVTHIGTMAANICRQIKYLL